jgi:hypothetical protein
MYTTDKQIRDIDTVGFLLYIVDDTIFISVYVGFCHTHNEVELCSSGRLGDDHHTCVLTKYKLFSRDTEHQM